MHRFFSVLCGPLWLIFSCALLALAATACTGPTYAAPVPTPAPPTLADFWDGRAQWVLDVEDTGLPVGESDTIERSPGLYWSFLHASDQSAGVVDSCGDPVPFPGCVTLWASLNGGRTFHLTEPRCVLTCNACPCDTDDHANQQQYPRVTQAPDGTLFMAYEHHAATWLVRSTDGVRWSRPWIVGGTGIWALSEGLCADPMRIGEHPAFPRAYNCMAGGPPGLFVADDRIYVFVGLGQSPAHMGCTWAPLDDPRLFAPCRGNPLISGSAVYGPLDARGVDASPYFDFRSLTSAEIVREGGFFYMAYEGIRGPSAPDAGRDDQFALGFARSRALDSGWEEYPGDPVLGGVVDNWGLGHADLLVIDGVTVMITATPDLTRGRYVLVWKR